MNRYSYIVLMAALLFCTKGLAFTSLSRIAININKKEVPIGSPVKLSITVNGTDIRSISWRQCDGQFSPFQLISTRDSNSVDTRDQLFNHQIIFTSAKPGKLQTAALMVIVYYKSGFQDTLRSAPVVLMFGKDVMITSLNDINPVTAPTFLLNNYYFFPLLVIAASAAFLPFYKRKGKKNPHNFNEVKSIYLEKIGNLAFLSSKPSHQQGGDYETGYGILTGFLNNMFNPGFKQDKTPLVSAPDFLPRLEDDDRDELKNIISQSEKLRFGTPSTTIIAIDVYLQQIAGFITNFHSQKREETAHG